LNKKYFSSNAESWNIRVNDESYAKNVGKQMRQLLQLSEIGDFCPFAKGDIRKIFASPS
jgi:hypothetical protein